MRYLGLVVTRFWGFDTLGKSAYNCRTHLGFDTSGKSDYMLSILDTQ